MIDHTNAANPLHTAHTASVTFCLAVAVALPVILFAAVLLLAILVSLRYAHGWAEVVSEAAAATTPMAADGVVGFVSALITAVGAAWFYVRQLAR